MGISQWNRNDHVAKSFNVMEIRARDEFGNSALTVVRRFPTV